MLCKVDELEKIVNKALAAATPSNAWNLIVSKNVAMSQEQIDIINKVTKENKEREYRDKNVISFSVFQSQQVSITEKKADDLIEIKKLKNAVSISNYSIVRVIRIKSTKGVPPIIVGMKGSSVRNEFIRKSHRKFNDVYVNPD